MFRTKTKKIFVLIVWLQSLGNSIPAFAGSNAKKSGSHFAESKPESNPIPQPESHRLTFELGSPRRFATRYLPHQRTLQIRIIPGRAAEFESTRHYDSTYVKRVVVQEENGEVILSLQLKNMPLAWVVAPQDNPWRLFVDLWQTESSSHQLKNEGWSWQNDASARAEVTSLPTILAPSQRQWEKPNSIPRNSESSVIDIPEALAVRTPNPGDKPESTPSESFPKRTLYPFPENFGRLEVVHGLSTKERADLQKKAGEELGSTDEYEASAQLGERLYRADEIEDALKIFRRLITLFEDNFQSDPRVMWLAGESAYLAGKWDLAEDYFRFLLLRNKNQEYTSLANLRLLDIETLRKSAGAARPVISKEVEKKYHEIALSEKSAWPAKIIASLRLVHDLIDRKPDAAKPYHQNLNACVNRAEIPIELQKNCAYILTRYMLEYADLASADSAIENFGKRFLNDARTPKLKSSLRDRTRQFLLETHRSKTWDSWIQLEKRLRPGFLDFTLRDPEALFARAEAWESTGDYNAAAQLYSLYWQEAEDGQKRNEAAAISARLFIKLRKTDKAELQLKRLETSLRRKTSGLTERATAAVRELALSPYRNSRALNLLLDEMRSGRFVERELNALTQFSTMLRKRPTADFIYDKILSFPVKSDDETKRIEETVMLYAGDLRESHRYERAGEMFLAVANLPASTKRAEGAYKAGIMFARAGLLEKAKECWQIAANDLKDKRFSSLASERLDRIR